MSSVEFTPISPNRRDYKPLKSRNRPHSWPPRRFRFRRRKSDLRKVVLLKNAKISWLKHHPLSWEQTQLDELGVFISAFDDSQTPHESSCVFTLPVDTSLNTRLEEAAYVVKATPNDYHRDSLFTQFIRSVGRGLQPTIRMKDSQHRGWKKTYLKLSIGRGRPHKLPCRLILYRTSAPLFAYMDDDWREHVGRRWGLTVATDRAPYFAAILMAMAQGMAKYAAQAGEFPGIFRVSSCAKLQKDRQTSNCP